MALSARKRQIVDVEELGTSLLEFVLVQRHELLSCDCLDGITDGSGGHVEDECRTGVDTYRGVSRRKSCNSVRA